LKEIIRNAALPFMRKLHDLFGDTVGLAVLDAKTHKGLIIEAVQGSRHRFSFTLTPGTWFPLHTGAPAKAIIAFLSPASRDEWLDNLETTRFTPQTITTEAAFKKELAEIKSCGYALDRSEEIEGCHCVAAPVFDSKDNPVAAIWITGPSSRLSIEVLHNAAPDVIKAAEAIAKELRESSPRDLISLNEELVKRTMGYLEGHLSEKVDWKVLSSDFGASYSKLRHVFAGQVGVPPSRYHLNLRVEEAKRLLRETALSVQEIAERTGFSDPNHFSALFSRKTGLSPTRFRESGVKIE